MEAVTKFGGQPVWIGQPQWPVSRELGKPMQFICQIWIDPALFGACPAQMAYVFITDDSDSQGLCETWDPNGGENAVILQPGHTTAATQPLTEGPSLYRMVSKLFKKKRVEKPCEYAVKLKDDVDPDFIPEDELMEMEEGTWEAYYSKIQDNKIGGTPCFVQNAEFPFLEESKLLLQINPATTPFWINFGDCGIGHVFMNKDGTEAKFGWQCH